MKSNKTGWGAAQDGKVVKSSDSVGNHDSGTNPVSSKDLNGMYDVWQGQTLSKGK